jgi:serine/threonine protein kinase
VITRYPGKVSTRSDVYSFGVVCLELLTSRLAYDGSNDPPSVVHAFEEALEDDVVVGLLDSKPAVGWTMETAGEVVRLTKLCLKTNGSRRPAASVVASSLLTECDKMMPPAPDAETKETPQEEASTCVICFDEAPTHAMVPCGHMCMCGDCIEISPPTRCYLCRRPVTETIKVFAS